MAEIPKLGKLQLKENHFSLDLDYFLGSNYDDISVACEELPPIMEWVAEQLHDLTVKKLIAKQEIKEAESVAFFELENKFTEIYPNIKKNSRRS